MEVSTATSMDDFGELVRAASTFSSLTAPRASASDLDGIPRLRRTLRQVDEESRLISDSRISTSTDSVHPAALRLLAEQGFAAERLRRAVIELQGRPPLAPLESDPSAAIAATSDAGALLQRQRASIPMRAADDARLSMNSSFRSVFLEDMKADLSEHRERLVSLLKARIEPKSILLSSPTPLGSPPGYGAMSISARRRGTPDVLQRTPSAVSPILYSRTPRTPHTRDVGMDDVFTSASAQTLPEADPGYFNAIRGVLIEGDAPSVASVMHETAREKPDHPHLLESIGVLAHVSSFVEKDGPPENFLRVHAARTVLEDQFADSTGVMPLKPRDASPAAVRSGVIEYVGLLQREKRLANIGDRPHLLNELPLWALVYYCFRAGNPEAALHVLTSARQAGNEHVALYTNLLSNFLRANRKANEYAKTPRPLARHETEGPNMDVENLQGESGGNGKRAAQRPPDPVYQRRKLESLRPGSLTNAEEFIALAEEYRRVVWGSGDAYYRVCYILLARLELAPSNAATSEMRKSISNATKVFLYPSQMPNEPLSLPLPDEDFNSLFASVEDYIWLRLWTCRTELEKDITDSLGHFNFVTLERIQSEMIACGPAHFDPNGVQPFLYAFVLICCGLFWEAVEFLVAQADERYVTGAAHLAIILHLLQWTSDTQAYASVLWSYVSVFAKRQPAEAATYLLTIRDRDALLEMLEQLLFDTRELFLLLGSPDGEGSDGILEDILLRMPEAYCVISIDDIAKLRRTVAKKMASVARDKEEYHQAVEMYALAGDREKSLRMLLRSIANSVDGKASPTRSLSLSHGRKAFEQMRRDGETGQIVRSIHMLLEIAAFFDEYHVGRLGSAWLILQRMEILPLTNDHITKRRSDLLPSSSRFDQAVKNCVPALLRAALDISEHALMTSSAVWDTGSPRSPASRTQQQEDISQKLPRVSQIKSLVTFSGLIGLSETEVNARLVRIELFLE